MSELVPDKWRKPLLYAVTAIVLVTIMIAAHDVMTPFVMAMVLAYVLTPAVSLVEAGFGGRNIPRGWAIVIVYVVVFGSLGVFVRMAAPRVGREVGTLGREMAHNAAVARARAHPRRAAKTHRARPRRQSAGARGEARDHRAPRADGSYAIDVGRGVVIEPKGQDAWIIAPREPEGAHGSRAPVRRSHREELRVRRTRTRSTS